ncbi:DUF885 domain-containing protein [Agaribacter marinus]|uniref:DUF885 domain-containing protein n=1 Tax=Agaribacter marinus TaxID=1431249 RepID=A0AA37SWR7_9ALTE|nr:DUF885 domain-containing protein [Agaribacter marinus]GLR69101.1 hypothetical protein GCM10007852_00090 [Agaribacter marinus]
MLNPQRQSIYRIKLDRILVILCSAFVLLHSTKTQAENKNFELLLDDIWQYELAQFPSIARSENLRPSRPLIDISMSAIAARQAKFTEYLHRLDKINADDLNASEKISLFMQRYRLQNYLDEIKFKAYRVPLTSEYGFHSSLASTVSNFRISTQKDLEDYLALLDAIPAYIAQNIDYMRKGMAVGHVQPASVLIDYEDTISPYTNKEIKEHPFFIYKNTTNEAIFSTEKETSLQASIAKVANAYQDFYTFFVNEYRPAAKRNIAATTWPSGEDFYNNRIRYYTTTDMSAEDIHSVGLTEVARIRKEMQSIIDALDFDGDIADFIHFLRNDPRFYAKTPKELIVTASYIAKQMDAKLPQLFYKMPRTPYGVAPVPDNIAPKYTTGRYISPRRNDQPGYYWVNTYALDKRPKYALPALTLHEAVPGHHFQISLATEMNSLPKVRRSTYISAFGEGWGLYAEFLGLEVGIYEDPYDNFGRLSYEMWRACRLVVDTGMHVFGWSREKAINYMLKNTALSEHNVRTEIDRYISWPAQALSYKIGEIKIKALRAKAENALGEKFDLRAFHDAILANGSVPLFVLETHIDQFIEKHRFTE